MDAERSYLLVLAQIFAVVN